MINYNSITYFHVFIVCHQSLNVHLEEMELNRAISSGIVIHNDFPPFVPGLGNFAEWGNLVGFVAFFTFLVYPFFS